MGFMDKYMESCKHKNFQTKQKNNIIESFGLLLQNNIGSSVMNFDNEFNHQLIYKNSNIDSASKKDEFDFTIPRQCIMEDAIDLDKLADVENRKLLCEFDVNIPVGTVFYHLEEWWIIIREEKLQHEVYRRYQIYKCNYMLKWEDIFGARYKSPVALYDYTLYSDGLDSKQNITTGNSKVGLIVPFNNYTTEWFRNLRFLISNIGYSLAKYESYVNKGVLRAVLREETNLKQDNIKEEIAYNNFESFSITVEQDSINMVQSNQYQIDAKIYKDNISYSNDKKLIYEVMDDEVASVDINGLVTALKEGSTTITISPVKGSAVKATINVIVKSSPIGETTYKLIGNDVMKYSKTETYKLIELVDGKENTDFDEDVEFKANMDFDKRDMKFLYNKNECYITPHLYDEYIEVVAIYKSKEYKKQIYIKSLF